MRLEIPKNDNLQRMVSLIRNNFMHSCFSKKINNYLQKKVNIKGKLMYQMSLICSFTLKLQYLSKPIILLEDLKNVI